MVCSIGESRTRAHPHKRRGIPHLWRYVDVFHVSCHEGQLGTSSSLCYEREIAKIGIRAVHLLLLEFGRRVHHDVAGSSGGGV